MEHNATLDSNLPSEPHSSAAANPNVTLPAGTGQVRLTLEVPSGASLEVQVEARTPEGELLERRSLVIGAALPITPPWQQSLAGLRQRLGLLAASWQVWLVWISLGVYALTRLVGLDAFPIYFFTDEAVQTVLAADLLRDHLHNYVGEYLPTFFENGAQYNLGVSVYLQTLPYLLFGKSVWVTRGTAALVTLLAALCLWRAMRVFYHRPDPWLAVLFLAVTPAWFLHSRTAFETSLAVTFFTVFLYFYLSYRCVNPRYLLGAVFAAALTFYAYSPARVVMVVLALLLFFSDLPYHWQQRRIVLPGLGLALLLALPFARFLFNHPNESAWHMRLLGSYWLSSLPLAEKLRLYFAQYLHALDPLYWYLPHLEDLARHTMPGYGHLLRQTFPLGILGVGLAVARFRSPAYRTLLMAILAVPAGASLVEIGITRVLFMVIPMALLTALAASWLLEWAQKRLRLAPALLAVPVFLLLVGGNVYMLRDALVNGPTWYNDYGLNGMQYGARQLFGALDQYIKTHPGVKLIVSPSWANGTDVVARFFFDDPLPFEMGNANAYYQDILPLDDNTVFVLIPEEYDAIPREKFAEVRVEQTLSYPNGQPGFYFVHLKYVDNIAEILAAEKESRRQLVQESFTLDGEELTIRHTLQDMGDLNSLFDQDPGTLIRTDAINPMRLQIVFPHPRMLRAVTLLVGGSQTTLRAQAWLSDPGMPGGPEPVTVSMEAAEEPTPRYLTLDLGGEIAVQQLWLEVQNTLDDPEGHVHLWEVQLR